MVLIVIQFVLVSISHASVNTRFPKKLQDGFDELWDTKSQTPNANLSIYEEWVRFSVTNCHKNYFLIDEIL